MSTSAKDRKLITALAVRNQGSRLYGKPFQNLHIESSKTILSNIIECLDTVDCIDQTVLGIAEGVDNISFINYAKKKELQFVEGDEIDVLSRLIACGEKVNATDIFRVTSESPFPSYNFIEQAWDQHVKTDCDATFYDDVVDGCGFEIIKLNNLIDSSPLIIYENKYRELPKVFIFKKNIYISADNFKKFKEIEDVLKSHLLIILNCKKPLNYLKFDELKYLSNWEAEKFRQKL